MSTKQIEIGIYVYTGLFGRGRGIVYAVHGGQNAGVTVYRNAVVTGGEATFDVVFLDGTITKRLPEGILRGVQWEVYLDEEPATQEEIASALQHAAMTEAEKVIRKAQEESTFRAEVERLKNNPEYKHLVPIPHEERYSVKLVAANIRRDLKKHFPDIKFSVRSESHGCVCVRYPKDAIIDKEGVNGVLNRYKAGYFDGMNDMYEYTRTPWGDVFGSQKYISLSRNWE